MNKSISLPVVTLPNVPAVPQPVSHSGARGAGAASLSLPLGLLRAWMGCVSFPKSPRLEVRVRCGHSTLKFVARYTMWIQGHYGVGGKHPGNRYFKSKAPPAFKGRFRARCSSEMGAWLGFWPVINNLEKGFTGAYLAWEGGVELPSILEA